MVRRISIVGGPGAGKTTLSQPLGKILGLEVFRIDLMFKIPGGERVPQSERQEWLDAVLQRESYIIDGGHKWSLAQRIADCDTLIWLDLDPGLRFLGVLRRGASRLWARFKGTRGGDRLTVVPTANFWRLFASDCFENHAARAIAAAGNSTRFRLVRLQSRDEIAAFLEGLRR